MQCGKVQCELVVSVTMVAMYCMTLVALQCYGTGENIQHQYMALVAKQCGTSGGKQDPNIYTTVFIILPMLIVYNICCCF